MVDVLEGVKIIDMTAYAAGPFCVRLLADWGADVIHIENVLLPDNMQKLAAAPSSGNIILPGTSNVARRYGSHRNKRSVTLDISHESGRKIFENMLVTADVFVSNFAPRVVEKLNLKYETLAELNPRLICANLSAYGVKGSDRNTPAYEHDAYFSRSSMLNVLNILRPAELIGAPFGGMGDAQAGFCLAYGIIAALFVRERTGVGQEVTTSLFQAGVFFASGRISRFLVAGGETVPSGNSYLVGYFQTKDERWLEITVTYGFGEELRYFLGICDAIKREDLKSDPRFDSIESLAKNKVALHQILTETFLSKPLDEWKAPLDEAKVPWSPVQNASDVVVDPQARANDFFIPVDDPVFGRLEVLTGPANLSKNPLAIRMPAPEYGQHTEEVLLEYGYTWEDIVRFREQHVIA